MAKLTNYTVRLERVVNGRRQGDAVTFDNVKARSHRAAEKQILRSLRASAKARG